MFVSMRVLCVCVWEVVGCHTGQEATTTFVVVSWYDEYSREWTI